MDRMGIPAITVRSDKGDMAGKRRPLACGMAVASLTLMAHAPATAQTVFDTLFGNILHPPRPATPVPPPSPPTGTAPLSIVIRPWRPTGRGGTVAFCVRLCDGRYFPLPRLASQAATPEALCRSLCPASRTAIYWGSEINQSVASNRSTYADLETAFHFRRALVANCTCNGRDVFGTAPVSIKADVTLQPGDIVAIDNGFSVYLGSERRGGQPEFVPAQEYSGLSAEIKKRLAATRVAGAYTPVGAPELKLQSRIVIQPPPLDLRSFLSDLPDHP